MKKTHRVYSKARAWCTKCRATRFFIAPYPMKCTTCGHRPKLLRWKAPKDDARVLFRRAFVKGYLAAFHELPTVERRKEARRLARAAEKAHFNGE